MNHPVRDFDSVGEFVADCCVRPPACAPTATEGASNLFNAYEAWCRSSGETPCTQTAFGRRLSGLGIVRIKHGACGYRMGLRLRPEYHSGGKVRSSTTKTDAGAVPA